MNFDLLTQANYFINEIVCRLWDNCTVVGVKVVKCKGQSSLIIFQSASSIAAIVKDAIVGYIYTCNHMATTCVACMRTSIASCMSVHKAHCVPYSWWRSRAIATSTAGQVSTGPLFGAPKFRTHTRYWWDAQQTGQRSCVSFTIDARIVWKRLF